MLNKRAVVQIVSQLCAQIGPVISENLDQDTAVVLTFGSGASQAFFIDKSDIGKQTLKDHINPGIFDESKMDLTGMKGSTISGMVEKTAFDLFTSTMSELIKDSTLNESQKKTIFDKMESIVGKKLKSNTGSVDIEQTIKDKTLLLKTVIDDEDYTKASELRDQITKLKEQLNEKSRKKKK